MLFKKTLSIRKTLNKLNEEMENTLREPTVQIITYLNLEEEEIEEAARRHQEAEDLEAYLILNRNITEQRQEEEERDNLSDTAVVSNMENGYIPLQTTEAEVVAGEENHSLFTI